MKFSFNLNSEDFVSDESSDLGNRFFETESFSSLDFDHESEISYDSFNGTSSSSYDTPYILVDQDLMLFFAKFLPRIVPCGISSELRRKIERSSRELFIGGIPYSIDIQTVLAVLVPFGEVKKLSLGSEVKKEVHLGYGFVTYEKVESARELLFWSEVHSIRIGMRSIRVDVRKSANHIKRRKENIQTYELSDIHIGYHSFEESIEQTYNYKTGDIDWADMDSEEDSEDDNYICFYKDVRFDDFENTQNFKINYVDKQLEIILDQHSLLFNFDNIQIYLVKNGIVIYFAVMPVIGKYTQISDQFNIENCLCRHSTIADIEIPIENHSAVFIEMENDQVNNLIHNYLFKKTFIGSEKPYNIKIHDMDDINIEDCCHLISHNLFLRVQMLWSCSLIYPKDLFDFIEALIYKDEDIAIAAIDHMWDPQRISPYTDPVQEFETIYAVSVPLEINTQNLMLINKIIVTPTKIYHLRPTLEATNNAIRSMMRFSDRFLRVSFTDEDFTGLKNLQNIENQNLVGRVENVLLKGVMIGDQKYEFLGYSSSQLKTNDCWFFNTTDSPISIQGMIKGFGDFSRIRVVGKYAARIGQKFSTTKHGCELNVDQIIRLPDIMSKDMKYTFSDGIGQISLALAKNIKNRLNYEYVPSAFQIRLGGCKGVLAVNPLLDGKQVFVRESMVKFESKDTKLEICAPSRSIPAYLNRQIIMLLSYHGIPNEVFMDLLRRVSADLDALFNDVERAKRTLLKHGLVYSGIFAALNSGISLNEPYFEAQLKLIRHGILKDIKNKGRLPIEEGRTLMGVMDETSTLKYGQVFIQYSKTINEERTTSIVDGTVTIVKNPALHPGDMRTLTAVDIPALHHLVDVIVFPSRGKRPHPDECSGSDLDGDLYLAIWDRDLVFSANTKPSNYTPPQPATVDSDYKITQNDVVRFFIDFMKNDNLGIITNYHLIWADKKGIDCKECIKLHSLASLAVDFPKSGVNAIIPRELMIEEFPDWMERYNRDQYYSKSILSEMYREFNDTWSHMNDFSYQRIRLDKQLLYKGYKHYIPIAIEERDKWNVEIKSLLTQYGLEYESELVIGIVVGSHKYNREAKRSWSTKSAIGRHLQILSDKFIKSFRDAASLEEDRKALASAYYFVTYDEPSKTNRPKKKTAQVKLKKHLLSFPWKVAGQYLFQIKLDNDTADQTKV